MSFADEYRAMSDAERTAFIEAAVEAGHKKEYQAALNSSRMNP